ncbi:unnamed protein product [Trichogramma brassicae]|uniref:Uncharacterized protein n=1 Tax=Trichogramma brassicae TaxID=86971 RepID=A0A6H5HXV1_9HYME|nr:unnamed protein product [Trichogramma brassicae]
MCIVYRILSARAQPNRRCQHEESSHEKGAAATPLRSWQRVLWYWHRGAQVIFGLSCAPLRSASTLIHTAGPAYIRTYRYSFRASSALPSITLWSLQNRCWQRRRKIRRVDLYFVRTNFVSDVCLCTLPAPRFLATIKSCGCCASTHETDAATSYLKHLNSDEPDVDKDDNLLLHRTTPLHRAVRRKDFFAHGLFIVYNRYEANYSDEFGLTHFHAACMYGRKDTVKGFLEVVRDPNYLVRETGDSPLHLALAYDNAEVVKFLLERRADPNLANKEGLTPIHILSMARRYLSDSLRIFIEFCDKTVEYKPPHVNAQDKKGNTPLHLAMNIARSAQWKMVEWLLRRGANPNKANAEGLTPLHVISEIGDGDIHDKILAEIFFKINLEMQKTVQVDAVDKFNRTPLQFAVVNFSRHMVNILLDQGADLSSFVFPTENHFTKRLDTYCVRVWRNFKLKLAAGSVAVVESLEKRGYELDQNDALTIMKLFAKYELFEKSADLDKILNDDEEFAIEVKQFMVKPSLSFYDLIQLRPKEAEKVFTFTDYFKFSHSCIFDYSKSNGRACVLNMCEKVSRKFFRSWALESFVKLTHYRLPMECCSMIIEELTNEDLYNICLAVTSQNHLNRKNDYK